MNKTNQQLRFMLDRCDFFKLTLSIRKAIVFNPDKFFDFVEWQELTDNGSLTFWDAIFKNQE